MSRNTPPHSDEDASGARQSVVWSAQGPMLRMEDAVVETVVTHTTRTTTSFAPIPLPRIPVPDAIPMPYHLASEAEYPLASEPTPDDLKYLELMLGGRRVLVQEDGNVLPAAMVPGELKGAGWTRQLPGLGSDAEGMGMAQFVKGRGKEKERKRPHEYSRPPSSMQDSAVPMSVEGSSSSVSFPRARSPPRKKSRPSDISTYGVDSTALASPLSSPGTSPDNPPQPNIGSGMEMAALFSLPSIVSHFEHLPDKVQQHVLMHLFRRARMPTIQRISSFASTALKRDFVSLLPHEIAIQVLRKLDVKSLTVAARVCRRWRKMIDSERGVWRARLVQDGMWYGHGVEEAEEQTIRDRFEIIDWRAENRVPKAGTPSDDESMPIDEPAGPEDRATPLKHIYRRRHVERRNWLHRKPKHSSFAGHGTNVVTCVQFDEDKIVSASDDHSIYIYETKTGQLRKRLDGHEGGVWALEYKGDMLISGSTDRTIRVWDLETLSQSHVFYGHTSTVRCLQIVEPVFDEATGEYQPPYPMIVTGSRDSSLRVWKLPKKGEPAYAVRSDRSDHVQPEQNPFHVHHLEGHTEAVRALATHGRLCVSGSYDKTVRVWDIVRGECVHVLYGHEAKVYSIVYDKYRNRCASGSMDNTVRVWDIASGQCLQTFTGHTSLVGLLGLSPNYIVSAAADASLRVWDSNSLELSHVLSSHAAAITCFQHDETKVVSGSDGNLKLWDIRTGRFISDLITGISSVWQVAFHGNLLVAASNRGGNTVFDVFDFGSAPDPSGVDDDSLDELRRQPWERGNPREPRAYQYDSDDPFVSAFSPTISPDARGFSPDTSDRLRALSVNARGKSRSARGRFSSPPVAGPSKRKVWGLPLRPKKERERAPWEDKEDDRWSLSSDEDDVKMEAEE